MTDNDATINAGVNPPYVQVGMMLRNECGEVYRVAEVYRVNDGPMMAKMVEPDPPPDLRVACVELRDRWVLAEPWSDE